MACLQHAQLARQRRKALLTNWPATVLHLSERALGGSSQRSESAAFGSYDASRCGEQEAISEEMHYQASDLCSDTCQGLICI